MTRRVRSIANDIRIDENNLEQEWVEQAEKYLHYASAHAEAIFNRDKAKSLLDLTYARLYSMLKKEHTKYFDVRPTEAALKEKILTMKEYMKVEHAHITANRVVNDMLAAKNAFEHRKKALENLVSLKVTGIYSEPRNRRGGMSESPSHAAQKKHLKTRRIR